MANYNVPAELRYSKTHEWVKSLGNGKYRMGISEYAAKSIGDVTYVELPGAGDSFDKGEAPCVIETVKSSEDVYTAIAGEITAANSDTLDSTPETLNTDCYGKGWLFEIKADSDDDFNALMAADEYKKFLETL